MKTFQEWLAEIANIPSGNMGKPFSVGDEVYLKYHQLSGVKDLGLVTVCKACKETATVEHPTQKNLMITVKQGVGAEEGFSTKKGYYALHRDV